MSVMSPQRVRDNAAKEMCAIFWFHMRIMAVLVCAHIPCRALGNMLPPMFAVFCNAFCLAERFWDVQLRSLVYWPPLCQCIFLVSRLLLMTISVVVSVLWMKIGWNAAMRSVIPVP